MKTGEEQYIEILRECLTEGIGYNDRTKVGRHGVWQREMRFDLRQNEIPLLQTKRVNFRWIFEELMWMLHGSTHEPHLFYQTYRPNYSKIEQNPKKQIKIWREWATEEQTKKFNREKGDLGPVYGHLWRNFGAIDCVTDNNMYCDKTHRWINAGYLPNGIDQLTRLLDTLRNNPFGTRHLLTGWSPKDCDNVALPPCHTFCHFKVWADEHGKPKGLSSFLYQRSCDMFLGVPYNMVSYCVLTYLLADMLGLQATEFVHMLGDAHVYSNHHDAIKEQLKRFELMNTKVMTTDNYLSPTIKIKPFERVPHSTKNGDIIQLLGYTFPEITIENYNPMGPIKAEVAI